MQDIISSKEREVKSLIDSLPSTPSLAIIFVGDNHASKVYVGNKVKKCASLGVNARLFEYPNTVSELDLLAKVKELSGDNSVDGIIVQLPLPDHIDKDKIINAIDPAKDVDGFHPQNIGKIFTRQINETSLVSCTPSGCLYALKKVCHDLKGMKVAMVGSSNIVGRPMAGLLLNEQCTVTIANRHTTELYNITKAADIIICAAGVPNLITEDMIKQDVIILDVGINRVNGKLSGDVDYENCVKKAKFISPVPGGIGRMTVLSLIENTAIAMSNINKSLN